MSDRPGTRTLHITLALCLCLSGKHNRDKKILEYALGQSVVSRMGKLYCGRGYARVTQFHSIPCEAGTVLCCVALMPSPGWQCCQCNKKWQNYILVLVHCYDAAGAGCLVFCWHRDHLNLAPRRPHLSPRTSPPPVSQSQDSLLRNQV